MGLVSWWATRRRNNNIPGQCSESRERMVGTDKHDTQPKDKREVEKEQEEKQRKESETVRGKWRDKERESGD